MAKIIVIVIFGIGLLWEHSLSFEPLIFPGECPNVPPKLAFADPSKLLGVWYLTHHSQKDFANNYHCSLGNVSRISHGFQITATMFNSTGSKLHLKVIMRNIPGLRGRFFTSLGSAGSDNPLVSKGRINPNQDVTIVTEGAHVMSWGCEMLTNGTNTETVSLQSLSTTTPEDVVNIFLDYLKAHGSRITEVFTISNENCDIDE